VDAEHASSATGSTFAHNRVAADGSLYHAFGGKQLDVSDGSVPMVLALHGKAGWVRPLDDRAALGIAGSGPGILHPRARFYAGGMQSVRGFAENELGPRVLQARRASLLAAGCTDATIADGSCDPSSVPSDELFVRPTGGSSLIEASAELRVPLTRLLGGVVFLDGAYVGTGGLNSPARGKGAITPGAGLRYALDGSTNGLFRPLQPTDGKSVPVVASAGLAALAGPDGILHMTVEGADALTVRIAAIAHRFPTAGGEFVVADEGELATALNADDPGAATPAEVYEEFAAVYLELYHFDPDHLPATFPTLKDDVDRVLKLLALDVDAGDLYRRTCPPSSACAVADPVAMQAASQQKLWFLGKNGLPELWPWRPERHREMLSEVALDAGRELVGVVLTRDDRELRLATAA